MLATAVAAHDAVEPSSRRSPSFAAPASRWSPTSSGLSSTALGRAEWLKYMALFLNEERARNSVYGAMKARYQSLRARAMARPESKRPLVMAGRSTRGDFVIAGGRSYVAALIADAGGRYVWADNHSRRAPRRSISKRRCSGRRTPTSGSTAAVEEPGEHAGGRATLSGVQGASAPGRCGSTSARLTADGSNDYWSRSVSRPDLVLADLIKIFHPIADDEPRVRVVHAGDSRA